VFRHPHIEHRGRAILNRAQPALDGRRHLFGVCDFFAVRAARRGLTPRAPGTLPLSADGGYPDIIKTG